MADGLDKKDAVPEDGLGSEVEPDAVVDDEAGDDPEGDEPEPLHDVPRPTVRPASARSYGPPQRRTGAHASAHAAKQSEPTVFGVSIRAAALIAAVSAVISVVASLAVSCSMQGMLEGRIDRDRQDLQTQITQQLDEADARISSIVDEYNAAAEAADDAAETNEAVSEAREDLRQTMADARAWLESGAGQWVGNQTETLMNNALDAAQNLIDESGIADPQTYRDAAAAIEDVIDGVEKGTLW